MDHCGFRNYQQPTLLIYKCLIPTWDLLQESVCDKLIKLEYIL